MHTFPTKMHCRSVAEAKAAVAEWRKRLPEVPPAVPEERDPFWQALPRALGVGAGAGIAVGVFCATLWIGVYVLDATRRTTGMGPQPVLLAMALLILGVFLFLVARPFFGFMGLTIHLADLTGVFYSRHLYRNANNVAAARAGSVALAVLALAAAGAVLLFTGYSDLYRVSVLRTLPGEDVVRRLAYLWMLLGFLVVVSIGPAVRAAFLPARRYCHECGGMLRRAGEVVVSIALAEQLVHYFERPDLCGETSPLQDLAADDPNDDPPWVSPELALYRCNNCEARLLEGDIDVDYSIRKGLWRQRLQVKWRWLSLLCSQEEVEPVEARLAPIPWWMRSV